MKYKSDAGGFLDLDQYTQIAIVNLESEELEQVTEGKHHFRLESLVARWQIYCLYRRSIRGHRFFIHE